MSDAFLGEDRSHAIADPARGSADAVFSWNLVSLDREWSFPGLGLALSAIRLMALALLLFLPETIANAGVVVKERAVPRVDQARHQSAPLTASARIRPHRRLNFISHFSRSRLGNPDDDSATDNSSDDDDDVWEELNASETSDDFLISWFPEFAPYLIPVEAGISSVGHARSTSAFLPPHRLRC